MKKLKKKITDSNLTLKNNKKIYKKNNILKVKIKILTKY